MNEKDLAIERITSAYELSNKRLWIFCFVVFLVCTFSNIGWVYYSFQYETVESSQEVTQENESGDNNFIGGDGDIGAETNH